MLKLTNWMAKRSGATITVNGINVETTTVVRVSNVTAILAKEIDGRIAIVAERDEDPDVELALN
jgi:hypothetical protein